MPNNGKTAGVKTPDNTGKKLDKNTPERQKQLASLISANLGKPKEEQKTIGELMLEAGYSESYSDNPKQLKTTATWQELMDKKLPEKMLLAKHKQLLNAERLTHGQYSILVSDEEIKADIRKIKGAKFIRIATGTKIKFVYYTVPDNAAQDSALDKGYKIRGSYKSDKNDEKANENIEKALDRLASILPD